MAATRWAQLPSMWADTLGEQEAVGRRH